MTDAARQFEIKTFIGGMVRASITKPDARDLQKMPGPSDLADQCDACVGRKIASALGIPVPYRQENFSLKAWNGTAVHAKLETDIPGTYKSAEHEITVTIAHIKGLGDIKGHVDMYVPEKAVVVDFKTTDMDKLRDYQATHVPYKHAGQTMLYIHGVRQSGRKADTASLVYIPRDSNNVSDIFVALCSYREDIVSALLNRAQRLTDLVRSGRAATLKPDLEGCYPCRRQHGLTR